jgi:hypothetical protein
LSLHYRRDSEPAPIVLSKWLALGEAWSVPFESGLPVRRFTSRKGQRHLSGLWWCATTGGHVGRRGGRPWWRDDDCGVHGEDEPSPGEREWTYAGDEELPSGPRRRWLWWVAFAAAVIALVVALTTRSGGRTRRADPTGRPSSPAHLSTAPTSTGIRPTPALSITVVGHRLLGITATWNLFARGTGTMVRIEFARGRITRTRLPGLTSSGPVFFLAAPHAAIVRPLDFVPGYLVPDGRAPRALVGALASGGVLLPGPASGQFWMQSGRGGATAPMVLVGPDGRLIASARSQRITIPPRMNSFPAPDGAGYLIVTAGLGGVYDLRPSGLRRITTGALLAVGPTRWLVAECTKQAGCAPVVINQATGSRRALPSFGADLSDPTISGVIAPDGHTAALFLPQHDPVGPPQLHLIDLDSGTDRRLAVRLTTNASAFPDDPLVWSPDSRWLFAIDTHGQLYAVDARTGRAHHLGVPLPPVEQLALDKAA